jgi:hypothetical protein
MGLKLQHKYREQVIWITALLLLFFWTPSEAETSLCILRFMGFQSCPGCGIGHSIHFALHFDFSEAWQHHFAGIPATVVMLFKIFGFLIPSNNKFTQHECATIPDDDAGITTR